MGDCLDTIEAAYRLELDDRQWLQGIVDTARGWLGGTVVITAWRHRVTETGALRIGEVAAADGDPEEERRIAVTSAEADPMLAGTLIKRAGPCATVSEVFGAVPATVQAQFPPGVSDGLGIVGHSPEGEGMVLTTPLPRLRSLGRLERKRFSRIAAHLATAVRLRTALASEPAPLPETPETEAVLAPDGDCVHAEGVAKTASARERLRTMVRDVDQARTKRRRRDPDEALDLWRGLVSGRWSLVDHFDSDGRRYVVAMRNPPPGPAIRALTAREQQVAALAMLGYSHKLTAYALGLAPSTVAGHLQRAIRKLGLRDRTQLIARLSPLADLDDGD